MHLLSVSAIKECITMREAIQAMENAFIQLANNQVSMPLRTALKLEDEQAMTLTMPAYLEAEKSLGLKAITIFPNNPALNKPSIMGFIVLLDAKTGEPLVMIDAAYLTALRTGAISGLATQYFSSAHAKHLAIIGTGAQAITQLEAVLAVRPINEISVWSRNYSNAEKFAEKMANLYPITVRAYEQVAAAVREADIICAATPSTEPLLQLHDLKPQVHINAVGSHAPHMREVADEVMGKATVIVDQLQAALAESGEIINAITQQHLKQENIIELGPWLLHKKPVQQARTLFKSVGLAIQDLSVARVAYENALKKQLGHQFDMSE